MAMNSMGILENYTHQGTFVFMNTRGIATTELVKHLHQELEKLTGVSAGISETQSDGLVIRVLGNGGEQLFEFFQQVQAYIWDNILLFIRSKKMSSALFALSITAIMISFFHTASGPDHYLPFIVLSRSRKWSISKTILLTLTCGLGHVLSFVLLGLIGLFLGWHMNKISWFQDIRGNVSSWALLAFGIIYLLYGIRQAYLNKPHKHFDVMNEDVYVYEHRHGDVVMPNDRVKVTPLVLFAIFVMGPSEPLIPLLFYSGTQRSVPEVITLLTVFTLSTVVTMIGMVLLGVYGYSFIKTDKLERYMHAVSGGVVMICGLGMVFFGW